MRNIYWHDTQLSVEEQTFDGVSWVRLTDIVSALEGYLQDLPENTIGLCLANDVCLPLNSTAWRYIEGEQWVALTALVALGIHDDEQPASTAMNLGDHLPNLTLTQMDGRPFNLHSLPKQRTILFAWASW